ncbi:hypothetical protein Golax_015441 [Gossypium laxum]|uniref:Reverse transcriptase zinc-binding domain-containing protein n=1 Tax=Gossypium laxum TaxID=34288 RepID=A0A7J8ZYE8_9ROSI|nr:hypothetical protein [Gossypium laxum]
MVTKEGRWNLEFSRVWLSEKIIGHITSIPPPHPLASSNRIAWVDTSSGCFSIKSASRMIKERLWNLRVEAWNLPWKEERFRYGIGSDARCSICGHELEDVIHAIRDCGTAKDVRYQITQGPVRQLSRVNSVEAERWIQLRIDETVKINTGALPPEEQ